MADMNSSSYFLDTAKTGARHVYHTGFLANDRQKDKADFEEVGGVAHMMMSAHLAGQVILTQRRLGEFRYEYIATKTANDNVSTKLRPAA